MPDIYRIEDMLNIRFIPEGARTTLWQWIGLPVREARPGFPKKVLVRPTEKDMCDKWRAIRQGKIPEGPFRGKGYVTAQLIKGGYYNQDSNGIVHATVVCSGMVIEELPLAEGIQFIPLPDEIVETTA